MSNIEDMNYYNDHRVIASEKKKLGYNEARQSIVVEIFLEDEEGGYEEQVEFPAQYVVCRTCEGRGKHVNPSIDCGGLTGEDFAEDPEFAESYFSGAYDVSCYECEGKRVVPEIDKAACNRNSELKKMLQKYEEQERELAKMEQISRAERMMGA